MSSTTWSIVLAAGEGSRLRALTTRGAGDAVPKQYCSLRGGRTLLGDALARAERVVDASRVVTIVAAEHRSFWTREFRGAARERLVVQPRNRGTAAGILLPLLRIAAHAPDALVTILPSDHHVQDEAVLARALRRALREAAAHPDVVVLLGIGPDRADCEYGWIVADERGARVRRVVRFVEKPEAPLARELFASGGLWNSFLLAGSVRALLALFAKRTPRMLEAFRSLAHRHSDAARADRSRLEALYESLESRDFSRDVLQGCESELRVLRVASCGWTDLGTPGRLAECLAAERDVERAVRRVDRAVLALDRALEAYRRRAGVAAPA